MLRLLFYYVALFVQMAVAGNVPLITIMSCTRIFRFYDDSMWHFDNKDLFSIMLIC